MRGKEKEAMEGAKESNKTEVSQWSKWGKPQTLECVFLKARLGKDSNAGTHVHTHTRAVSSHRPLVTVP